MPLATPIQLTLYGPNDEPIGTYSRAIITTRFLERAIDLVDTLTDQGRTKEVLNALDQLLVDFYGGQFTIDQIKDCADFAEKMAVLEAIMARAGLAFGGTPGANPTPPGETPR